MGNEKDITYEIHPIGFVRKSEDEVGGGSGAYLEILEYYRDALKELNKFSHVIVLWWAEDFYGNDIRNTLRTRPPYAEGNIVGVFATRAPYRPNPIAMTTCEILSIDEEKGIIQLKNIDSFDGTSVIDLKAYVPICDRVEEVDVPEWLPQEWTGWWTADSD
ncbi:tRNA-Thr(GGU) m(6)t(6)A37 methyltransferase TsaA [Anaerobacterium chartisolvens]|uniref:tRNA-Thr(GGU) m(6)t(6)A37 methyltransferase TsaA n=1 Tax=Anaerobacterium chartisolvens TaxID=1297424 RepID=A0A369BCM2_9FIRM|nr:tRNA (N6-threonylcarbamoyladenosine(37)-N6)-methyltransferase TrmO [Anaerobacterium chartisolvens]RCX18348.1 tRNA-Thr(GGU) m(6)t(6)A37 methyltransferase TsaA [Anaerobacterium chartisolvens]